MKRHVCRHLTKHHACLIQPLQWPCTSARPAARPAARRPAARPAALAAALAAALTVALANTTNKATKSFKTSA